MRVVFIFVAVPYFCFCLLIRHCKLAKKSVHVEMLSTNKTCDFNRNPANDRLFAGRQFLHLVAIKKNLDLYFKNKILQNFYDELRTLSLGKDLLFYVIVVPI